MLLYSLPRSSLQGANPWVVIEELAAVTSSDRLRLVADGVGIEPTRPLRTRQPGGSASECKSGALPLRHPSCIAFDQSAPAWPGGLFVGKCPNIPTFLCPHKPENACRHKIVCGWLTFGAIILPAASANGRRGVSRYRLSSTPTLTLQ